MKYIMIVALLGSACSNKTFESQQPESKPAETPPTTGEVTEVQKPTEIDTKLGSGDSPMHITQLGINFEDSNVDQDRNDFRICLAMAGTLIPNLRTIQSALEQTANIKWIVDSDCSHRVTINGKGPNGTRRVAQFLSSSGGPVAVKVLKDEILEIRVKGLGELCDAIPELPMTDDRFALDPNECK
jgi:hypothetical protein